MAHSPIFQCQLRISCPFVLVCVQSMGLYPFWTKHREVGDKPMAGAGQEGNI